jgi:nitrate reductase beta subunit
MRLGGVMTRRLYNCMHRSMVDAEKESDVYPKAFSWRLCAVELRSLPLLYLRNPATPMPSEMDDSQGL